MSSTTTFLPYDTVDGHLIHKDLKGRTVPIPPKLVRDRVNAFGKTKYAWLAAELKDWYPEGVWEEAAEYVFNWPSMVQMDTASSSPDSRIPSSPAG